MQRLVSLFFKIGSLNKLNREILKTELSLTSSFVRFLSSPKKGKIKIMHSGVKQHSGEKADSLKSTFSVALL